MIIGVAYFQTHLLMLDGFKKLDPAKILPSPCSDPAAVILLSKSEAKTCQRLLAAEIGYP
jgi:hypothetical protein